MSERPTERERLKQGERAYDAGDFARVHELASELSRSGDPEVARRAGELLGRVSIDGVALGVLGCSLFFLLLVARQYVF